MFNSKLKRENEKLKSIIEKMNREQRAENFNFNLILEQIHNINNATEKGKGVVLKNYTQKKESINDVIELAKKQIEDKIVELDIDPQY